MAADDGDRTPCSHAPIIADVLDLLIRGGRVIDGSGAPAFEGDVGIAGDRIIAVGRVDEPAARTLDVGGLFVCPGFVDMHTHSDLKLLSDPGHEAKACQAFTLKVLGQDGLSYAPVTDEVLEQLRVQLAGWNGDPPGFDWSWRTVGEYLDRLDEGIATNTVYLVPHGTLRLCAMGYNDRAPTDAELAKMKRLLGEGLQEGAVGLSAGLTYAPGMYADDDELAALLGVVREYGGLYVPHHRNYAARALEAYAEQIDLARRAGVPLHLAHAHLSTDVNKGRAPELLQMLDEGDVTLDTYPYLAGNTYLHALLPTWAQAGGPTEILKRLRDRNTRDRLKNELELHDVRVEGRMVTDVGDMCDLLLERELAVSCTLHSGNEENVRAIMQHPAHTVGSDGILVADHPRAWGTFPRYFAVYVRELGILGWEEMVRKMTSLAARRLGISDRGLLRAGMHADVTCIDPDAIRDTATYEHPRRLPEGIPYVLVNGVLVVDEGRRTDALPGRAIRSR